MLHAAVYNNSSSIAITLRFCVAQQVSWVRRHEEELHLLTVGMQTYSTDSRFSLHFQHPNDWRLQIKYARPRDEGIYECQVSIHPPRIYTVRLIVVGM